MNLRTDSEAFAEEIRSLSEAGHGAKIRAEIESLTVVHPGDNWDLTLKRWWRAGRWAEARNSLSRLFRVRRPGGIMTGPSSLSS